MASQANTAPGWNLRGHWILKGKEEVLIEEDNLKKRAEEITRAFAHVAVDEILDNITSEDNGPFGPGLLSEYLGVQQWLRRLYETSLKRCRQQEENE